MLLTQNLSGFGFMVGGNTCDILSVSLGTLTNGVLSDLRNQQCITKKIKVQPTSFMLERWECGSVSCGKFSAVLHIMLNIRMIHGKKKKTAKHLPIWFLCCQTLRHLETCNCLTLK